MLSNDPSQIADDLSRLLLQLRTIQAGDLYGDDRVARRMIVERLSASGLHREAEDLKPSIAKSYPSGPTRGDQGFIDEVQAIIEGLRAEPDLWTTKIIAGLKRTDELEARSRAVKMSDEFVSSVRIEELRALPSTKWDVRRLVRLCEEINIAFAHGSLFSLAMLVRAVQDHVPPLFDGEPDFDGVVARAKRPYQKAVKALQAWRVVADRALHLHIDRYSPVITPDLVNVNEQLSVLIDEVIRRVTKDVAP